MQSQKIEKHMDQVVKNQRMTMALSCITRTLIHSSQFDTQEFTVKR